jgi:excisionase family DNA binding protein
MSNKHSNYISTTDLATYLNVSRQTIFRKIKENQIEAIKVGKNFKIPLSEVKRIKKEGI